MKKKINFHEHLPDEMYDVILEEVTTNLWIEGQEII